MVRSNRKGGPRTDQGKLVSSRNAIKTGSYSALIILPGESEEDFRILEEQFFKDFSPEDIAEAAMVRSLAGVVWKKLRAEKLEHSAMIRQLKAPFLEPMFPEDSDYLNGYLRHELMNFVAGLDDRDVDKWHKSFQLADKFKIGQAEAIDVIEIDTLAKPLYEFLFNCASNDSPIYEDHRLWLGLRLREKGAEVDFLKYFSLAFLNKHQQERWAIENLSLIRRLIAEVKESRLLTFLQHQNLQRIHDDLDRAFFRTLTELRNHQKWRRDQSTIVIGESED